jgi:transposase
VVTDLHGVTGRDIMDHLIAGERDPKALAQLARARARRKITELEQALEGAEFFAAEHAALLKAMLERIDRLNADIGQLTEVIERLLAPYEEQLQQAESMPGWGRRSAEDALAETGPDMSRFPTPAHLASWAGRTPLDNQSGKRAGRSKHKKVTGSWRRGVPAKLGPRDGCGWSRAGVCGDRCAARAPAGAVTGSRVADAGPVVQPGVSRGLR